ncbi:MAG: hypothetical protein C0596_00525 [Marinilabiliales bacterium]|nr:MAG: hypothetical protein C0596_00525 [Marinilabiliales bacterium]
METRAKTVEEYLETLPEDKKSALIKLRDTIKHNIPEGFKETMAYGMPSFVVPHEIYPKGYHVNPNEPLPFISFASQKNNISIYHMGMYSDTNLMDWFLDEYPQYLSTKPNIGKSCVRFRKPEQIPYQLIADLVSKMTPQTWIDIYEKNYRK